MVCLIIPKFVYRQWSANTYVNQGDNTSAADAQLCFHREFIVPTLKATRFLTDGERLDSIKYVIITFFLLHALRCNPAIINFQSKNV